MVNKINKIRNLNSLRVMMSLFKLGAIGFGGGAALLPLIEHELVENTKWMDKKKFDVATAIASISPGSFPVSLCTIWDPRYSLQSAFAYALPGSLIYLVLLTGFSLIGESGTKYLKFTSVGLIAFVLFILFRFILRNYETGVKTGIKTQYMFIITAAFLLTNGNALQRLNDKLFGIPLPLPFFSINMVTLMLMTFFIICFVADSKSKIKLFAASFVACLYALAKGRAGILQQWSLMIFFSMITLAIISIIYD
jgi:chromate transporter